MRPKSSPAPTSTPNLSQRRGPWHVLLLASVLCLLLAPTASAQAQTFAPIMCPVCPATAGGPANPTGAAEPGMTFVPYSFAIGHPNNFLSAAGAYAQQQPPVYEAVTENRQQDTYTSHTNLTETIAANANVNHMLFRLRGTSDGHHFQTEPGTDGLLFMPGFPPGAGTYVNPNGTTYPMTNPNILYGYLISGEPRDGDLPYWYDPGEGHQVSLQDYPLVLDFVTGTDTWTHNAGFDVDGLELCCGAGTQFIPQSIFPGTKAQGVLLGTNDTVFFTMEGPSDTDAHTTFAIWSAAPANNIDQYGIYVWCNGNIWNPTPPNTFQWAASDANPQDKTSNLIHIDGNQCTNGVYTIAVNDNVNFTGTPTVFNILGSLHSSSKHYGSVSVGVNYGLPAASPTYPDGGVAAVSTALTQAARAWFGASSGTMYIEQWDFNTTTGTFSGQCVCNGGFCDVCFKNCDQSSAFMGMVWSACKDVWAYPNSDPAAPALPCDNYRCNAKTLVHELTHAKEGQSLAFWDAIAEEYSGGTCAGGMICEWCGHTIMSDSFQEGRNTYCTFGDHTTDGTFTNPFDVCDGSILDGWFCLNHFYPPFFQCDPMWCLQHSNWTSLLNQPIPSFGPGRIPAAPTGTPHDTNFGPYDFHEAIHNGTWRLGAVVVHNN